MARIARIVAVNLPHHITQRGNYHQNIFIDNRDREEYLRLLNRNSEKNKLKIISYCLMSNHVHMIVIPSTKDSMAKTMNIVNMKYAQYFNAKKNQRGHLWQDRYYSCILEEKHLIAAARYVERNPVRAGLVKEPWKWEWSSAKHNIEMSRVLHDYTGIKPDSWKEYIGQEEKKDLLKDMRRHTITGRPLASENFIKKLENKLKRNLTLLPRGRPKITKIK
ncbi:MAG: hypothetical protein A2539_08895 [Elusimicrobia bacterium RIFOXYD2_FULL_34_15]|nr:MAG: hypothetical protein A2539_08895 [Elusimicrobia bacterium RIFOXYD2_FULL_34_15]